MMNDVDMDLIIQQLIKEFHLKDSKKAYRIFASALEKAFELGHLNGWWIYREEYEDKEQQTEGETGTATGERSDP